jgi:uncharacterized protein YciI
MEMLFALICTDKPGKLQVRADTRSDHLAHLQTLNEEKKLTFAGPFLDADGKPNGTLAVIDVPDMEAAKAVADADPYAKAGLFDKVEIRQWNWGVNNPANG